MSRILGLGLIAIVAGCSLPTPAEREAKQKAHELRAAQVARQSTYDATYDHCLYRVTGPFAGASIEVMRECERQARDAAEAQVSS